jgi:hypothetical protein
VDDGAFVGGDGVGSVVEGGADVVDGGLAGFDVEGCGFEEDVGLGFREPVADVSFSLSFRLFGGRGARAACFDWVEAVGIRDPAQAAGGDAGEAEGDAVAIAQFLGTIFEEADQGPVDVAEAEEAEVVGADWVPRAGAKARWIFMAADAALKRRSSTGAVCTDLRAICWLLSAFSGQECPPHKKPSPSPWCVRV